jgi:Glycosyl transferase family 2
MKLVTTLLARDEADVVEAQIAFHLNAGADLVIVTDNRSSDGTTEILESLAREGQVHLIREEGTDFRQSEWVTRMARLAATDFGADWVINTDADEFWWPRGGDLKEVLAAVPKRYGIVRAIWRPFCPRPARGEFFAESMIVRLTPDAPINDPSSPFRPQSKVAHRADPQVVVTNGNHGLQGSTLAPLHGWYPFEALHFPIRSLEQWERKNVVTLAGWRENPRGFGTAYHEKVVQAQKEGRTGESYEALLVDDDNLERGLEDGSLTIDTRLRDVLRTLRLPHGERAFALPSDRGDALSFPRPTVVEDAAYAVEAAALGEADVIRLQRRLDSLEQRLLTLEAQLPVRAYRRMSRTARRVLRRPTG